MKVLITSGGTRVPIDDVRYIGNMSTGRFGAELAQAFADQQTNVVFFHEKNSIKPINNQDYIKYVKYNNYDDYLGVKQLVADERPDIIISAAAVSDYIVDKTEGKISSDSDELVIRLKKAEKILPSFKAICPAAMVVGFKLLVSPAYQDIDKAIGRVFNNRADMVVFNDLTAIRKGDSSRLLFHTPKHYYIAKSATMLCMQIIDHYELTHSNSGNL
jgi:phosphopantothenate---cysteine ligase (CTP)